MQNIYQRRVNLQVQKNIIILHLQVDSTVHNERL